MPFAPGTRLGPYEILAPLGAGGMGEVYKARDTRLGRIVALKTSKAEFTKRYETEARAIAALNHPHICQLYDIGPNYLVLEYVEGKPVKGPLSEHDAIRLAVQIAGALELAHKQGILHRDLKPDNVLVTGSGAKLLDFGLAKLTGDVQPDATQTVVGTVMGTAAYMSPEQAQGKPVDERSDVFSFGAMLYEMFSGQRAFGGASFLDTLNSVVRSEPAPLTTAGADVVKKCLAKSAERRFQNMTELRAALERLSAKPATEQLPSIAVLPFANMSGDPEQEYFSDGLAEDIINALTHVPGLKVIARTSAFSFKGKNEDVRRIAETLGVVNILEGSVRKAGNRIRVTAQLITAADGTHLWSERYDRELTDVFAIQDEISVAITEALRLKLGPKDSGTQRHRPSIPAYEAYLKSRYYRGKMTPGAMARHREYLEQTIALDPKFALAYVDLADTHLMRAYFGGIPQDEIPKCRAMALKALEMDPTLPETHAMLGIVAAEFDWDWREAEARFRVALAADPVPPIVHQWHGFFYLFSMGHASEGAAAMERGLADDPLNILSRQSLALCNLGAGDLDAAESELRKCLELDETLPFAWFVLAAVQACRGQRDAAQESAARSHAMVHWPFVQGLYAALLHQAGDTEQAQRIMENLSVSSEIGWAMYYLQLKDVPKAADWVQRALLLRNPTMRMYIYGPFSAALRASEYWAQICKLRNLPA